MLNLKNLGCTFYGCTKPASHYAAANPSELLCYMHKTSRMISLKNKKCEFSSCKEKASCGEFGI
jgi:hypothetical protein